MERTPEQLADLRKVATAEIAAANPVDVDVVTDAFLAAHPEIDLADVPEAVELYKAEKPALFVQPQQKPKASDRYIVETTTVFELLGSTVTYREGQIVVADSRDYDIARDHNVPLRPLAPIKR